MQARLRGDFSVFAGAGRLSQADLTVAPPTQVFRTWGESSRWPSLSRDHPQGVVRGQEVHCLP